MQSVIAGKYEIVSLLGIGAMGLVYEAQNRVTGRRVALKLLGDKTTGVERSERFFREARATAQIDSQHVAQVLDAGIDDGKLYIVLELLRGTDLAGALATRPCFEPSLALRLVGQACIGLATAHASGVLHRDIKPANIFLAQQGGQLVVKLLDFGLAKAITPDALGDVGSASLTNDQTLLGTPRYMSPEQARGAKAVDARSDLWSLSVVLYEALTGVTPHEEEAGLGSLIIAICSKQVRLAERSPTLPVEVAAIVDKGLALDPADRFQTADEMMLAIRSMVASFAIDSETELPVPLASVPPSKVSMPPLGGDDTLMEGSDDERRTLTLNESRVRVETSVRAGYLLACVRGRMSSTEDAHRSNAFLRERLAQLGLRALLLDARQADGTKEGHAGLWEWLREHHDFDRFAFLVESSALMRGLNLQAEEYGVNVRAFDSLEHAEAWLREERG